MCKTSARERLDFRITGINAASKFAPRYHLRATHRLIKIIRFKGRGILKHFLDVATILVYAPVSVVTLLEYRVF